MYFLLPSDYYQYAVLIYFEVNDFSSTLQYYLCLQKLYLTISIMYNVYYWYTALYGI